MEQVIIIILLFLIALLVFVILYFAKKGRENNNFMMMQQQIDGLREQLRASLEGSAKVVNQQLDTLTRALSERLSEGSELMQKVNRTIGERLDNAAKVIGNVQKSLGQVEEANKRIYEVGKDIAGLQEILRAPKFRGSLGELFLGDLLMQILPTTHFATQYAFESGEKVDAVIKVGDNLVPVDSKFPLENFRRFIDAGSEGEKKSLKKQFIRDVKKHIDDIQRKYVKPDEGTFDFALMYVPAENVYYETILKDESFDEDKGIFQYSINKRVIPVSPNSFYAYLQVILLGLRGFSIEERARDIFGYISRLSGDFERFRTDFELVGTHLSRSRSSYENAEKRLLRLESDVERMTSLEEGEKALPDKEKTL